MLIDGTVWKRCLYYKIVSICANQKEVGNSWGGKNRVQSKVMLVVKRKVHKLISGMEVRVDQRREQVF